MSQTGLKESNKGQWRKLLGILGTGKGHATSSNFIWKFWCVCACVCVHVCVCLSLLPTTPQKRGQKTANEWLNWNWKTPG